LKISSTTHPQIDEQTKVVNHTLVNLLQSIFKNKPRAWDQALLQVVFAYCMVHSSMGISPFAIVYRRVPHLLLDLTKQPIGEKFSNAASILAEQVLDVQEQV